ncbi:hypothetical protein NUW58_g6820 [Xylaria curta]|uniref:Uncharacterized protein n=1 Tax=Xylaria curta TaxID=42375 RepID=A0ACC1NQ33_9PEZI|nr:hypothetical protein NUW58_g6820 [Xylaria curta]
MAGKRAGVPDAWDDDDWEVKADQAAAADPEPDVESQASMTKAQTSGATCRIQQEALAISVSIRPRKPAAVPLALCSASHRLTIDYLCSEAPPALGVPQVHAPQFQERAASSALCRIASKASCRALGSAPLSGLVLVIYSVFCAGLAAASAP